MTVPPTRGRNRWRPGENCRTDATLRQEEESEICFARSFLLESALCWNSEQGLNDGNRTCRATRKRCRTQQTMRSSSRWSGGTGPEELEKLLILNSNRWRTFDNAHLEIVTFVEAKLGLRIRDSKPSQTGGRGHADPKDVDALDSLASGTGKGSTSPRHGRFQCGGAHVQRDCHVHVTPRKGNGKKGSRANHGPRVLTKERARKIRETDNPKGRSTGSKSAKSSDKGKCRTLVHLVCKTPRNRDKFTDTKNLHNRIMRTILPLTIPRLMMAGMFTNGMMTGTRLAGMNFGNKPMTFPQAHFLWEVLISVQRAVRSGLDG